MAKTVETDLYIISIHLDFIKHRDENAKSLQVRLVMLSGVGCEEIMKDKITGKNL